MKGENHIKSIKVILLLFSEIETLQEKWRETNQQALEIPCISEIPSQRFQPNHGYCVTILLLYLMGRKRRRIVRYVTAFFIRSFSFCSLLGGERERGFFLRELDRRWWIYLKRETNCMENRIVVYETACARCGARSIRHLSIHNTYLVW